MRLLLVLVFLICASATTWARPNLPKPYVVVPVIIDSENRGQLWIFPRAERKDFALESEPLLLIMSHFLREDLQESLANMVHKENGTLSIRDLDGLGLTVRYLEKQLEIQIEIPVKFRKQENLNINYDDTRGQKFTRPSKQSGYLNLRSNQTYQYGDNLNPNTTLPLTGRLDLVENINGVVLESGAEFTEHNTDPWIRQDTHIIWDSEEKMLRFTLGDLYNNPKGFQASFPSAGVSVERKFSIQPYRTATPLGNSELYIKRISMVEIYVNGNLVSQLRLAPGRFNIKDFPIVSGQNNVKIKIKDDLNQEETFDFSVLFENTILLKGTSEFGYFLGEPWHPSGADRAYANNTGLLSLYHRYGLTDDLTIGFNLQSYKEQNQVGGELSFILPVGYLSLNAGYSKASAIQEGYGELLKFRSLDRIFGFESKTILTMEIEKRDPSFLPVFVGDSTPNTYASRADLQVTRQISEYLYAGIGGSYTKGGSLLADSRIYRANVIVPFSPRFRVEGTYSQTYDTRQQDQLLLSMNWIDTPGVYSVAAYYDNQAANANINVTRNNLKRYDDYRLSAALQNGNDARAADVSADYFSQLADLRIENYSSRSGTHDSNLATLGVNTALAWVGSEVAITQPIQDSFGLIKSHDLPKGQVLLINPNGENAEAQLGPLESTVLNQYTSYYKYTINIDSTSLPPGYLLNKEFYPIFPSYKSGILIPINLISKIMIKGHLLRPNLKPAAFVAGDIFDANGRLVDNNFFTSAEGFFVIEGLEPGIYTIRTNQADLGSINIEVQKSENNIQIIDKLVASTPKDEDHK